MAINLAPFSFTTPFFFSPPPLTTSCKFFTYLCTTPSPCIISGRKFELWCTCVLQVGESALWTASGSGHLDIVMMLVAAGANVNQCNKVCEILSLCYHVK